MNELEWLQSDDPAPMLVRARLMTSSRKMRLVACACCRRVLCLLTDEPASRAAVDFAERLADGLADAVDATSVHAKLLRTRQHPARSALHPNAYTAASETAANAANVLRTHSTRNQNTDLWDAERMAQTQLIRCIVGNPFRTVAFDPRWRTADMLVLARAIYDDRSFGRMPILEDALKDAGCENEEIINHCCSDGPHVRGCWVVDLILGKE
jgi:hypothetical protein